MTVLAFRLVVSKKAVAGPKKQLLTPARDRRSSSGLEGTPAVAVQVSLSSPEQD